ncbi:hypothetical protein [Algoriphagus sp. PAP.12]|uniref:hypothetical protein n=1 Tax=Algoriphagus sp. PAP.12 TaxID=2996678 RepID=UPI00227AB8CB|nr:hypothetical protein [Algoriphagus sp. PAP.12]
MKKIFGFKVSLNEQEICRAGFEKEDSIVTCILHSVRRANDESEELNMQIGGMNSETHQHFDWAINDLNGGDIVTIEVISEKFDAPVSERPKLTEEELLNMKLKHYHRLKEELKDHIDKE